MVVVAICEDETKIGAELERALVTIFAALNVKHEIDVFYSGADFARRLKAGAHYDLIFLDIEFVKDEISGVDIGCLIRDTYQNNMSSIVYISWEKNYAMQLFKTRPMDFLIKPLQHDEIERAVKTYLKIASLMSKDFTYKKGHGLFKMPIKDIAYLENKDRRVIIHLTNGKKEEFYGSLKEVYNEQLSKCDFLFIHASYLVNYDYITSVKFNNITLTGSIMPLPISPSRRDEVREAYARIMKRRRM